jgi:hypothetical protein
MSKSQGNRPEGPRNYEVGYGRPPVATRFQPGGVGNPKGRSKNKKTVGRMIQDALMTRITIEDNGRSRTVTAQEFIFLKLVRAAAGGDIRAINALFGLRERYQDSNETSVDTTELASEDRKLIETYFAALPKDTSENASPLSTNGTNLNAEDTRPAVEVPLGENDEPA